MNQGQCEKFAQYLLTEYPHHNGICQPMAFEGGAIGSVLFVEREYLIVEENIIKKCGYRKYSAKLTDIIYNLYEHGLIVHDNIQEFDVTQENGFSKLDDPDMPHIIHGVKLTKKALDLAADQTCSFQVVHKVKENEGNPLFNLGTSKSEQAIFKAMQYIFPKTENKFEVLDEYELDIFIPELLLVIEYDGARFHDSQRKRERDLLKNKIVASMRGRLIRIREQGLEPLYSNNTVNIIRRSQSKASLNWCIMQVLSFIVDNYRLSDRQLDKVEKVASMDISKL